MRWDTLKQQELDLKLRIKVLKKQLVEPNRSHDQYEEIQTTLDVVLDEYQDLLMKKFKKSLGRWIQSFREDNLLVRTVDCMFASLEKEDQEMYLHSKISHLENKNQKLMDNFEDELNEESQSEQLKRQLVNLISTIREQANVCSKSSPEVIASRSGSRDNP